MSRPKHPMDEETKRKVALNLPRMRPDEYTPEQVHEMSMKGVRASAEARKKHIQQRDLLQRLMQTRIIDDPEAEAILKELGMPLTYGAKMALMTLQRACTGDIEAARYVRDTSGEKPADRTELAVSQTPVQALDLTKLTDAELEALADRALDEEEQGLLPD